MTLLNNSPARVALNRAQKSVKALPGVVISEATLLKFVLRLPKALIGWEQAVTEQLLSSPAMHVDETSLRVDRENHWIHVYFAGDITLKHLHRRRWKEAMESITIIPRYGGTPFSLALAIPSACRSVRRSFSNSAIEAGMLNISLPVEVSIF